MNENNSVYEQESRPVFAPGFQPVEFSEEEYHEAEQMLDVKIDYAHWAKKMGMVQIRVKNHFISMDRISYWAEEHKLIPTTIYSIDDEEHGVHLQVNFQYND